MKNTHVLLIKFKIKYLMMKFNSLEVQLYKNWVTSQIYYTTIM